MNIRIDKGSDVTVHRQLAEQIVFLIATGKLKPGDALPSVRAMNAAASFQAAEKLAAQLRKQDLKGFVVRAAKKP